MKSTRAPSPSRGVQRRLSEMPDVATQAHWGPRSHGSDHGSKSQRAGTEKRAGERHLPSRSESTRKRTHHIVKCPHPAGIRGSTRGPSHLHPTRENIVNPATTRSYVEVVRGVARRSGWPTTASGSPHSTRYTLLPVHPHTPHNTHPLAGHQPFPAFQRTAPSAPPNTHRGVERPLLPNNGQHPPQPTPARAIGGQGDATRAVKARRRG